MAEDTQRGSQQLQLPPEFSQIYETRRQQQLRLEAQAEDHVAAMLQKHHR